MYVEIRLGNNGFMDRPYMDLKPGESYTFYDVGEDTGEGDVRAARFLLVQCNTESLDGTLLILPDHPEISGQILQEDIPDEVLKRTKISRIDSEPQTTIINNPQEGLNAARAIFRYIL